jgi:hypothetical protein
MKRWLWTNGDFLNVIDERVGNPKRDQDPVIYSIQQRHTRMYIGIAVQRTDFSGSCIWLSIWLLIRIEKFQYENSPEKSAIN